MDTARWTRRGFLASPAAALLAKAAEARPTAPPLISFRIGVPLWDTDARLKELLEFFARHPGAVDELAFFTSGTHPPLPYAEMERRAARLADVMPQVRKMGMRSGINHLSTLGHLEENLPHSLNEPWQRVMDLSGKICRGTYCPSQPELLAHTRKVYTLLAQAKPDFLWVDDDLRMIGFGPVRYACFCDLCLRNFAAEAGRSYTREQLAAAFRGPGRGSVRKQWIEHNSAVLANLLHTIEQTVHAVDPDLELGLMTGDRFYEGYAFERWARELAGPRKVEVRWRPGGGFYDDGVLAGLAEKANAIGRQVAALPSSVVTIQSELENFPYQRLAKSAQTVVAEAGAYMAAGCTGTAFNVMTMYRDPVEEYIPLYDRIVECRPFYHALQSAAGRSVARGVWPAWDQGMAAIGDGDDWPGAASAPYILQEIGIPICYDPHGRVATVLSGRTPLAFSRDRLREIFSGGVLMDAAAWTTLAELGLAKWTGVSAIGEGTDHDAVEVLSTDERNGRFAGWSRDCRQSFWRERAYDLRAQSDSAAVLAHMVDYAGAALGTSMTAFTNELGGRVVVMGYYPWKQIHSLPKATQMKAVCGWLSGGTLPAMVESFHKVAVWSRERATVVLNQSLDPAAGLVLRIRTQSGRFTHMRMNGETQSVTSERLDAETVRVRLRAVEPWSMHLLTEA